MRKSFFFFVVSSQFFSANLVEKRFKVKGDRSGEKSLVKTRKSFFLLSSQFFSPNLVKKRFEVKGDREGGKNLFKIIEIEKNRQISRKSFWFVVASDFFSLVFVSIVDFVFVDYKNIPVDFSSDSRVTESLPRSIFCQ